MKDVKEGVNVVSHADLQNLVASVILRQTDTFTQESIYKVVKNKLRDSAFQDDFVLVNKHIAETISALFLCSGIKCEQEGRYKLNLSFPSLIKY